MPAIAHSALAPRDDAVVADERARIAVELQDVLAHALSAMTVQAAGARRLILTPAGARAHGVRGDRGGRA